MQIIVNEGFIKRRRQIAQVTSILGFACFAVGLYLSFDVNTLIFAYALLAVGLVAFNVSRYHTVRWGMHTREDTAVSSALKGLDKSYSLYQYAPSLPASHVLVGPNGVTVIEIQVLSGRIRDAGQPLEPPPGLMDWLRSAGEGRLGNPTRVALKDIEAARALLQQRMGDRASAVNVDGVIAFANGQAFLDVEQPTIPVMKLPDLKEYMRRKSTRKVLPANVIAQINDIAEGKA